MQDLTYKCIQSPLVCYAQGGQLQRNAGMLPAWPAAIALACCNQSILQSLLRCPARRITTKNDYKECENQFESATATFRVKRVAAPRK
jgi:hypothetical protein